MRMPAVAYFRQFWLDPRDVAPIETPSLGHPSDMRHLYALRRLVIRRYTTARFEFSCCTWHFTPIQKVRSQRRS